MNIKKMKQCQKKFNFPLIVSNADHHNDAREGYSRDATVLSWGSRELKTLIQGVF